MVLAAVLQIWGLARGKRPRKELLSSQIATLPATKRMSVGREPLAPDLLPICALRFAVSFDTA
jgi:hypothetical protein